MHAEFLRNKIQEVAMNNIFRMQRCSELRSEKALDSVRDVVIALANHYGRSLRERMVVVYFCQGKPLGVMEYIGTATRVDVSVGEIAAGAVKLGATAVFGFHTHPSGGASLSQLDKKIIDKLSRALDYIGIELIDVFVMGNGYTLNEMCCSERFYSAKLNLNMERKYGLNEFKSGTQRIPHVISNDYFTPLEECESEAYIEDVLPLDSVERRLLMNEYMESED